MIKRQKSSPDSPDSPDFPGKAIPGALASPSDSLLTGCASSLCSDANVRFSDVEEAIAWLDSGGAISQCSDAEANAIAEADCSSSALPMLPRPTVCVDFDGVLNTYTHWRGPDHVDPVRPGAFEFLEELHRRGYRVVICTARDSLDPVLRWLEEHHLLSAVEEVTNRKPVAVAYIDDRAIRFEGDFGRTLGDLDRLAPVVR